MLLRMGGGLGLFGQKLLHVTPAAPSLGTLAFSSTAFVIGTPSSGTINGATSGSTITATGLPTGVTINGTARTWAYDGSGSASSGTITLTETLVSAANSPHTSSVSYTVAAAADTTAPTLSSPTGSATGSTTGTSSVTTNEGNGTLYAYLSTSATPPTATNLKAGTGAVSSAAQSVTATGVQSVNWSGLTASTTYYTHWLHRDAAGNDSSIVSGAGFTTSAAITATYLPTLASAPVAVYGTRKLVSAYAGACLRVRRASDNTEQDFGFDANGLVDYASAFTFAGTSSCFVTKWYDQSGNGNDAAQTTLADQPLLDSVDPGRIIFDGQRSGTSNGGVKSKCLDFAGTLSVTRNNCSAFAVVRPTVSYNNNLLFQLGPGLPNISTYTASGTFGVSGTANTGTIVHSALPDISNFDNIIGRVVGATNGLYLNDAPIVTAAAPSAASVVGGRLGRFMNTSNAVDNSFAGTVNYSAFIVYPTALSGTDVASLQTALKAIFTTTATSRTKRIVYDGDSIQEQYFTTKNRNITQLTSLDHPEWEQFNLGISGRTLAQINTAKATNVQPLFDATKSKNIVVCFAGINDTGTTSSTTGRGLAIRQYCAAVKGYGFQVIVGSLTGSTSAWALNSDDANRQAYNADLQANWASFADGFIDFASRAEFADPSNTTYFADGLHPTDAGAAIRASMIETAIAALP